MKCMWLASQKFFLILQCEVFRVNFYFVKLNSSSNPVKKLKIHVKFVP